jgi:hypothetical protein
VGVAVGWTEPLDGMVWMLGLRSAVVATVRAIPTAIIAITTADILIFESPL